MSRTRRRWPRRLLAALGCTVVVLFILALAAEAWIIPAVIRTQIQAQLAEHWDGRVEVDRIEFHYFGPIRVHGLSLTDRSEREWLRVGRVEVELGDWPGLSPHVRAVRVSQVAVVAHFVNGACAPPILHRRDDQPDQPDQPDRPAEPDEPLEIRTVRVSDISVELVDHDTGRTARWGSYFLTVDRDGHELAVALSQGGGAGQDHRPLGEGTIDVQTLSARLHAKFTEPMGGPKITVLLGAIRLPEVRQVVGELAVDVTVTGELDDLASLAAFGSIGVGNGRVLTAEGDEIAEVNMNVQLRGRGGTLTAHVDTPAWVADTGAVQLTYDLAKLTARAEIVKLTATFPDEDYGPFWRRVLGGMRARGRLTASGWVDVTAAAARTLDFDLRVVPDLPAIRFPADYSQYDMTDVKAERMYLKTASVSVKKLTARLPEGDFVVTGSAAVVSPAGPLPALGDWAHLRCLAGEGYVYADDVQSLTVPVLSPLLDVIVPGPMKVFSKTDLEAAVTLTDGVLTIQRGRVANALSALELEQPGTVNLLTEEIDIYVVGVALAQLRSVLLHFPLLKDLVKFRDKLTRVRIKGKWSDSDAELIRKDSVTDLGVGTKEFFHGVVKTGGDLGPGIVKGIAEFFEKLTATRPAKP